jgi:hypothetical protein
MQKLSSTSLSKNSISKKENQNMQTDSGVPIGVEDLVTAGFAKQTVELEILVPTPAPDRRISSKWEQFLEDGDINKII